MRYTMLYCPICDPAPYTFLVFIKWENSQDASLIKTQKKTALPPPFSIKKIRAYNRSVLRA